ncbi:ATP-dependent Clp protease ATP-binding subunit ClpE [Alicyclobacillus vulcanalis]|uniref:ATP-dependent Clp protease ATP-binding subunit ClpE n=1 Tax=Alicyclobacillus vulcanalis TaxID=252246 RepID=A0A1N7N6Y6_9BACL|nr:ATP-dependent Clp protease ATP-binding subunit ClpE [Alicyclobacillus vulcanalis]
MEDGRLTDSQGRTVSFKDTLIIMTSNAGEVERKNHVGFAVRADEDKRLDVDLGDLSAYFKPEFLNRFDAIVRFRPLGQTDVQRIVELMLTEVRELLAERGVSLSWTEEAVEWLAKRGYHPAFGARPLRRTVQTYVEDPIAEKLIDEEVREIALEVTGDSLTLRIAEPVASA